MKHEQVVSKWTIAEMKDVINQERTIRQQAQVAAEQALTAAKEAQKVILQLEKELDEKDQQLQQERTDRKQAELASKKAANIVGHASNEGTENQPLSTAVEPLLMSEADVLKREGLPPPQSERPGGVTAAGKTIMEYAGFVVLRTANLAVRYVWGSPNCATQEAS
jgi:uncharacterized protein (UPF0305 family)